MRDGDAKYLEDGQYSIATTKILKLQMPVFKSLHYIVVRPPDIICIEKSMLFRRV